MELKTVRSELNSLRKTLDQSDSDKREYQITIKKLEKEIVRYKNDYSDIKSSTYKTNQEKDSYIKENKLLRDKITNMEQEIKSQLNELDQYENESKAMDREITRLKKENKLYSDKNANLVTENNEYKLKIKELNNEIDRLNRIIKELNLEIEKLNKKIKELSGKLEDAKSVSKSKVKKNKNVQFCELYKSFSQKILLRYKLEMIIGMFVKRKEREMQIRIDKINELYDDLRKRNKDLMEELALLKKSPFITRNDDNQEITNIINKNIQTAKSPENTTSKGSSRYKRYFHNRSNSEGIAKVVKLTREISGNIIVNTTKISYKRKKQG